MSTFNGLYSPGHTKSSVSRRKRVGGIEDVEESSQHEMSMQNMAASDSNSEHSGKFMKGEVRVYDVCLSSCKDQLGKSFSQT